MIGTERLIKILNAGTQILKLDPAPEIAAN